MEAVAEEVNRFFAARVNAGSGQPSIRAAHHFAGFSSSAAGSIFTLTRPWDSACPAKPPPSVAGYCGGQVGKEGLAIYSCYDRSLSGELLHRCLIVLSCSIPSPRSTVEERSEAKFLYPATINVESFANLQDEGVLLVRKAGEMLCLLPSMLI